jgi:hypothetical protein
MFRHSANLRRSKTPPRDARTTCFKLFPRLRQPSTKSLSLLPSDSEFFKTRPSFRKYWLTIPFQLRFTWPRCMDLLSLTDRRLIRWPLLAASHLTAGGPEESLEGVPEKEGKNLSVGCVGHLDLTATGLGQGRLRDWSLAACEHLADHSPSSGHGYRVCKKSMCHGVRYPDPR